MNPMRWGALMRRAGTRPAGFLCRRAIDAARKRFRATMADHGRGAYRAEDIRQDADAAHRLSQLDRSLVVHPDHAPRIARHAAGPDVPDGSPWSREIIQENRVRLLGRPPVDLDRIDWSLDHGSGLSWPRVWHSRLDFMDLSRPSEVKVPWELGKLQFLSVLGRAYARRGDEALARRCAEMIVRWDEENPVGWGVQWAAAMNACLRALSLLWARTFFGRSPSMDSAFWARVLRMLVEHGRFAWRNIEYSDVRGNHYSSNLLGLLQIGLALPWLPEARMWRQWAFGRLTGELLHETYPDGVCHEGSVPYHRLVLEIFLHAVVACRRNGLALPGCFCARLERMLEFTMAYTRPHGAAPLLGDNDDGRVQFLGDQPLHDHRYLLAAGAVLFRRADFKTAAGQWWEEAAWLTGEQGRAAWDSLGRCASPASAAFPDAGFWCLRSGRSLVTVDCGDVGLRGRGCHGHHDALSVTVCLAGRDVIVDNGTHNYTSDKEMRRRSLSAAWHNAVVVDGLEPAGMSSWDIPAAGAYPCRPVRWDVRSPVPYFEGLHRGYADAAGAVCRREVRLVSEEEVRVTDRTEGSGRHHLQWRWLLAPELDADPRPGDRSECRLRGPDGAEFRIAWSGEGLEAVLEDAERYPSYGVVAAVRCLTISGTVRLPHSVRFVLSAEPSACRAESDEPSSPIRRTRSGASPRGPWEDRAT